MSSCHLYLHTTTEAQFIFAKSWLQSSMLGGDRTSKVGIMDARALGDNAVQEINAEACTEAIRIQIQKDNACSFLGRGKSTYVVHDSLSNFLT